MTSAKSVSSKRLLLMFVVELTSGFELLCGSHWWFSRPLVQGVNLNKVMYVPYLWHFNNSRMQAVMLL